MKNEYEICGDYVRLVMKTRKGEIHHTFIDVDILPKVIESNLKFHVSKNKFSKLPYAKATVLRDGKKSSVSLHRFVIGEIDSKLQVDHINHNTLDNRLSNLRVVTVSENQLNRIGPNITNKSSGIMGISWSKRRRKWEVRIRVKHKRVHVGYFNSIEEAETALYNAKKLNLE